jgi:hypothetical protein
MVFKQSILGFLQILPYPLIGIKARPIFPLGSSLMGHGNFSISSPSHLTLLAEYTIGKAAP